MGRPSEDKFQGTDTKYFFNLQYNENKKKFLCGAENIFQIKNTWKDI